MTIPEKREEQIGQPLNCKRCDEVGLFVAEAVLVKAIEALQEAYNGSATAAMCKEGQIELALDRLKILILKKHLKM